MENIHKTPPKYTYLCEYSARSRGIVVAANLVFALEEERCVTDKTFPANCLLSMTGYFYEDSIMIQGTITVPCISSIE